MSEEPAATVSVTITAVEYARSLAEAWERGHFYCAAEHDGSDQRCVNPYGRP